MQIGPISLQDFEVPSSVRFGGRHRLAVHRLANGNRVVERLGPDDSDITFQGTFSGPNAEARVRAFDHLRLSGKIVWLTWESFKHRVIVRNFAAEYHSSSWIPYQVNCLIVDQEGAKSSEPLAIDASIMVDLASALSAASGSSVNLSSLQSALSYENSFVTGTSDHSRSVAAVAEGVTGIDTVVAEQTAILATRPGLNISREQYGEIFSTTVNCAGSLAAAVNARAYIGRIGVNLNGSII